AEARGSLAALAASPLRENALAALQRVEDASRSWQSVDDALAQQAADAVAAAGEVRRFEDGIARLSKQVDETKDDAKKTELKKSLERAQAARASGDVAAARDLGRGLAELTGTPPPPPPPPPPPLPPPVVAVDPKLEQELRETKLAAEAEALEA